MNDKIQPPDSDSPTELFRTPAVNPNTRRAYSRAAQKFEAWCRGAGLSALCDAGRSDVASYLEELKVRLAPSSVALHLAAIRMLFDELVMNGVVQTNPAREVRGPTLSADRRARRVLTLGDVWGLVEPKEFESPSLVDFRDRLLICVMFYAFVRVSVALELRLTDVCFDNEGWHLIRLPDRHGHSRWVPCPGDLNDCLQRYLRALLDSGEWAGDREQFLFRSARGRSGTLSNRPMSQSDAWRMIQRRLRAVGIQAQINNESFRAAGISRDLRNGGDMELVRELAGHKSRRTTARYAQPALAQPPLIADQSSATRGAI